MQNDQARAIFDGYGLDLWYLVFTIAFE